MGQNLEQEEEDYDKVNSESNTPSNTADQRKKAIIEN